MKKPLEEAAELFKECEKRAGDDRDKAALYRGLRLLADGLRRMERELADVESEMHEGPSRFYHRRLPRKGFRAGALSLGRKADKDD
jgi:hypothetical protein